MSSKPRPLTDADWYRVFELRCASKRGNRLTPAEFQLVQAAHAADPDRYAALGDAVFEATAPFGANLRKRAR